MKEVIPLVSTAPCILHLLIATIHPLLTDLVLGESVNYRRLCTFPGHPEPTPAVTDATFTEDGR